MSDLIQVLVMMAAPATLMLTLRRINLRADRSPKTETRPAQ